MDRDHDVGASFEPTSKRRRGFPSESRVKRGDRIVGSGTELIEKLGRDDPCPCRLGPPLSAVAAAARAASTACWPATTCETVSGNAWRPGHLTDLCGTSPLAAGRKCACWWVDGLSAVAPRS